MPGRAPRRLPGVRFVAAPPPVDALPRMDIAVFVGFASEGPLDVPVAVESAAELAEIFGEDARLAWDSARGEAVYAHLGPAVRAFFRNGGRRCWVVRVAGDGARSNAFPITGLLRASGDELVPAVARARAEGSFSDGLRVSAALLARPVALDPQTKGSLSSTSVTVVTNASSDLVVGDLLRFTFRDARAHATAVWMLPVTSIASADPGDPGTLRVGQARAFRVKAQGTRSYLFYTGAPALALPAAPPTLVAHTFTGDVEDTATIAVEIVYPKSTPPDPPQPPTTPSWKGGEVSLLLDVELAAAPAPGSFLRVDLEGEELWVRVRDARRADTSTAEKTSVTGPALRRTKAAPTSAELDAVAAGATTVVVERLRMELWTQRGDAPVVRLADLGLGQRHPRFWGALPTDAELYGARLDLARGDGGPGDGPQATLWQAAAAPRFPLAGDGEARPTADPDRESFYLPIGMAFTADAFLEAVRSADAAPRRDGLEGLSLAAFLDRDLADATTTTLLAEANFLRYQSPKPRALRGIHAALAVEEATLIAAPDAVHRRWGPRVPPSDDVVPTGDVTAGFGEPRATIAAPSIAITRGANRKGDFAIGWNGARAIDELYVVQESRSASFAAATTVFTDVGVALTLTSRATGDWFYRVRTEGAAALGPWSSPLAVQVPDEFHDRRLPLAAPEFQLPATPDATGTFTLTWLGALNSGDDHVVGERFVVEESSSAGFEPTAEIYAGTQARLTIWGRSEGDWFYRVRIENAAGAGPWSGTFTAQVRGAARAVLEDPKVYSPEGLLDVQRALLRMCAARGDLLAVLALPEHYREVKAIDHAARLADRLGLGESAALSYGALYHPWLLTRDEAAVAELRRTPPDGAITGLLAQKALTRGAWIAPANDPLTAVVALTPILGREGRQALQDAQINLIRQEPGGFLVLDADTLSAEEDLVPIHVRRMLSLVRRAALQLGATYVFEPNDRSLRRLVQRGFEALLGLMFARGAFAGRDEASSFEVIPDDGPSTSATAAEGRFSVDLRVAPAAPMTFLTVRLVQSGDGSRVSEVR